jgi:hypothetical protein
MKVLHRLLPIFSIVQALICVLIIAALFSTSDIKNRPARSLQSVTEGPDCRMGWATLSGKSPPAGQAW